MAQGRLSNLNRTRVRVKEWKAQGLCPQCGHEIEDKQYKRCQKCRKQSNERYHTKINKRKFKVIKKKEDCMEGL